MGHQGVVAYAEPLSQLLLVLLELLADRIAENPKQLESASQPELHLSLIGIRLFPEPLPGGCRESPACHLERIRGVDLPAPRKPYLGDQLRGAVEPRDRVVVGATAGAPERVVEQFLHQGRTVDILLPPLLSRL